MKCLAWIFALAVLMSGGAVRAGIAERVVRGPDAGLDLILYPTPIRDVVTIVGSLPAGDAFVSRQQAAVATLTGMMLDRGAHRHRT